VSGVDDTLSEAAARELASASGAHLAGRLDEAIAGYEALLAKFPAHAELRYRAGIAYSAKRAFDRALPHLVEAARLEPQRPAAWLALGLARRELGDASGALSALQAARDIDPATPQASGQMGLVLQSLGRLPEAIERFSEEATRYPQSARNHNNLGMALLAAGREAEAKAAFIRALRQDRDYVHAHANLAALSQRQGDLAEAEAAWRNVIRLAPHDAPAHVHLGHLLTTAWRLVEAETVLRRAVALAPENRAAAHKLAYVLRRLNRPGDAREIARAILARDPDDLQANVIARLALPVLYESAPALANARRGFASGLESLLADLPRFERDAKQVFSLSWENFHLAYHGQNDRPLQEEYARFVSTLGRACAPDLYEPCSRTRAAGAGRLRVGLLSSFFRDCTVGKYFESWTALDRAKFEVTVYYTGHVQDKVSARLAASVEHYRHVIDSPDRVARTVIADGLDVLVFPDVGMDTASYVLAGMRLAPVQCAAWGHPVTTGQANMDFFLTCAQMEPEGAEEHYSERLVRLPGIGTRYSRPALSSARSRAELGLPEKRHLYLCPQSLFKIHPDNDPLFARVLAGDPEGHLVLFQDEDEPLTEAFCERLVRSLSAAGIEGRERTTFLRRRAHDEYLNVNVVCDVMLDTLHWSGGNTSLDALSCGLPVVSLPGRFMRGRQSAAMLRLAGVPELVARDETEYVAIANRMGRHAAGTDGTRERLRSQARLLFDDSAPLRALEEFLLGTARQGT
jgi:predicted O-linked N-acetylglucosamine transferase (SPINDLY family)